uniref:Major facilitator superfamily (MFS) profile domain-containing protein n=1 Tax=Lepeophtheirus salmonis TaxID=72036 RepID=A0A0K2UKU6_LEPSM
MMEIVSGNAKTILGCAPHFNYAFWGLSVAMIAYLVPDWRKMQLIFSVPLVVLLSMYWILPESPRWLHTHGYDRKAEIILRKIVSHNKSLPIEETDPIHLKPMVHHHHSKSSGQFKGIFHVLELFKTPNMCCNTLIIYFMWFATSLVYYGLTLNSNDSGGASIFIYFSAGKLIEIPAVAIVIILVLKTGRRFSCMLLFFGGGICLLSTMFIQKGVYKYDWPLVMLNVIGRGCSVGNLAICYVYSAELFPTVIRNVGIGSSSVWARIGPMIAPFIKDLEVYNEKAPIVTLGIIAILACFMVSFLPETKNHKVPDTLAECEQITQGDNFYTSLCSRRKNGVTDYDLEKK